MGKRLTGALTLLLFACILHAPRRARALDEIRLTDGTTRRGRFLGYRNTRFYFEPADGTDELHVRYGRVESLRVDPPARIEIKGRGLRQVPPPRLTGYAEGDFLLADAEGQQQAEIPVRRIFTVELQLDFERSRALARDLARFRAGDNDTPPLEDRIRRGVITIVHFHKPGMMASQRQGTYVKRLADESRGRIVKVTVEVGDWESPVAERHGIASLPQFWFYNRRGQLTEKLVERFTGEDIDAALRRAKR